MCRRLGTIIRKRFIPDILRSIQTVVEQSRYNTADVTDVIFVGNMGNLRIIHKSVSREFGALAAIIPRPILRRGRRVMCNALCPALDLSPTSVNTYATFLSDSPPSFLSMGYQRIEDSRLDRMVLLQPWNKSDTKVTERFCALAEHYEGVMLCFTSYEHDSRYYTVLCEFALPLPPEMRVAGRILLVTIAYSNLEANPLSITISDERTSTILLKISRSPTGLTKIDRGTCVSITPEIRRSWQIARYTEDTQLEIKIGQRPKTSAGYRIPALVPPTITKTLPTTNNRAARKASGVTGPTPISLGSAGPSRNPRKEKEPDIGARHKTTVALLTKR